MMKTARSSLAQVSHDKEKILFHNLRGIARRREECDTPESKAQWVKTPEAKPSLITYLLSPHLMESRTNSHKRLHEHRDTCGPLPRKCKEENC